MIKQKLFTIIFLVSLLISNIARADNSEKSSSMCDKYFPYYESKHHMPSNLLRAVAVTESGKWNNAEKRRIAWPWTVNVKGKGYYFDSKNEAISFVEKQQEEGAESIDVGCMQINLKHHPKAFISLEQAFEPKYNVEYAADFLNQNYLTEGSWKLAIGSYHNKNPEIHASYIERVYSVWRKEDANATSVALLSGEEKSEKIRDRSIGSQKIKKRERVPMIIFTKDVLEKYADN